MKDQIKVGQMYFDNTTFYRKVIALGSHNVFYTFGRTPEQAETEENPSCCSYELFFKGDNKLFEKQEEWYQVFYHPHDTDRPYPSTRLFKSEQDFLESYEYTKEDLKFIKLVRIV